MFILIIALYDTCHIILAALFAPQEIHKLPEVRIQPLIGIYRETPFSRTAVQHNVAGGGKIIDPWEIKQDVRILLCHGPASVGRPGVGHDQLTGDGSPQRGQGLQAPCEAADVILKMIPIDNSGLFIARLLQKNELERAADMGTRMAALCKFPTAY